MGDGCWLNGDGGRGWQLAGWDLDGRVFISFGLICLGIWGSLGGELK